jgi:hypothetical protein
VTANEFASLVAKVRAGGIIKRRYVTTRAEG